MDTRALDDAVVALAMAQHGAFTIQQVTQLGVPRSLRRERVRQRRWLIADGKALVLAGSPDTWRRRLMIELLVAGRNSAVSDVAALAIWGLKGFAEDRVAVVAPFHGTNHRLAQGVCHETRYLPESHVRTKDGLRVVCVERALCDAASIVPRERLPRMVDDAILQRLTTTPRLLAMCNELSVGYRRGLKELRNIVLRCVDGLPPTESDLEDEFLEIVRKAGLAEPERQVTLGTLSAPTGRVDFLFRPRLVAEVDGTQHELSQLQRAEDRRRDEELTAAGYVIERFTKDQIRHNPESVKRRLWAALARAA